MTGDERWMRRALELAARGTGETNPNPLVGCVVVRGGRVMGEGFHARAGEPHAEVHALERAGARARGATLYVNLEPCAHRGRTPPCAPRLVEAGVRRVVVGHPDPNPLVKGRGLRLLRRAGLRVETGLLRGEALRLNRRFVVAARRRRPFLLLKAALTLDGRIATRTGESKWITSPQQRRQARWMRRLHDGVLVGIGTVLSDDPLLLPSPRVHRPFHRIVLDASLRLPPASRLAQTAARSPVLVLCGPAPLARRRRLEALGVEVLAGPAPGGRIPLGPALRSLWRRGLWSLMVEGGSEVLGAFLRERLVDEVALFRAPLLLGGRGSRPAFGGSDPARLSEALRLRPGRSRPGTGASPAGPGPGCELWYPVR